MRICLGFSLFMCLLLICPGCIFQSKKAALKEMCTIPSELIGKPKQVGPYLASRISNKEVMTLLTQLNDPEDVKAYLRANNIDVESCDLMKVLEVSK